MIFNTANYLLEDASFTYQYDNNGNQTRKTAEVGGAISSMISGIMNRIGREIIVAYPIPLLLVLAAWLPVDLLKGIVFSPHGGLGWLLLLASFPWLTGRILLLCFLGQRGLRLSRCKRAIAVLLGYLPVSLICAYSFTLALNPPLSNTVRNLLPWFYFPLSLSVDGW